MLRRWLLRALARSYVMIWTGEARAAATCYATLDYASARLRCYVCVMMRRVILSAMSGLVDAIDYATRRYYADINGEDRWR